MEDERTNRAAFDAFALPEGSGTVLLTFTRAHWERLQAALAQLQGQAKPDVIGAALVEHVEAWAAAKPMRP